MPSAAGERRVASGRPWPVGVGEGPLCGRWPVSRLMPTPACLQLPGAADRPAERPGQCPAARVPLLPPEPLPRGLLAQRALQGRAAALRGPARQGRGRPLQGPERTISRYAPSPGGCLSRCPPACPPASGCSSASSPRPVPGGLQQLGAGEVPAGRGQLHAPPRRCVGAQHPQRLLFSPHGRPW